MSAGCQEEIVHDLSEREANRVVSELHNARLSASKIPQADGRWAIAVSADEMVSALKVLEFQRVLAPPNARATSLSKGAFIPSREEQIFRYERAMSEALEDSLAAIPGVLEARVHLNLPPDDPLLGSPRVSTGSGSVLLLVGDRCEAKDEEVAHLVGGAAGLPPGTVKVLRSRAESPVVAQAQERSLSAVTPDGGDAKTYAPPLRQVLLGAIGVCVAWVGSTCLVRRRRRVKFALLPEMTVEGDKHGR
jgi:type III secretory pathway lipoprotein EscJ